MTEISALVQWAFGGFWRWLGFAILLYIVAGWAHNMVTALLAAFSSRMKS